MKKKKAKRMSVDDFLSGGFDSDAEEEEDPPEELEDPSDSDSDSDSDNDGELPILTNEVLDSLIERLAKEPTIADIKAVIGAFVTAVHLGEDKASPKWRFVDHHIFNRVVVHCLTHLIACIDTYQGKKKAKQLPSKRPHWKRLSPHVSTFLRALSHFLSNLTEPGMVAFVLHQTESLMPYFRAFDRLAEKHLKVLLGVWATTETGEWPTSDAYLAVREIATGMPAPFAEKCMKGLYLEYIRQCKSMNIFNYRRLDLMAKCVAAIYNVDLEVAYQQGFVYIRQLSLHLRKALQAAKKESYIEVYNWQFVCAVSLWAQVLSAHDSPLLKPLIFPLTQVALGAVNLIPTVKYYPLRITILRALIKLSAFTDVFIPIAPLVLDMLNIEWLSKRSDKSKDQAIDIDMMIRAPNNKVDTMVYKHTVVDDALLLLAEYSECISGRASFPEIVLPILARLRHLSKNCRIPIISKAIRQLTNVIVDTSNRVTEWREGLDVDLTKETPSPPDNAQLPIVRYAALLRTKREKKVLHIRMQDASEEEVMLVESDEQAAKEDAEEVLSPSPKRKRTEKKERKKKKKRKSVEQDQVEPIDVEDF